MLRTLMQLCCHREIQQTKQREDQNMSGQILASGSNKKVTKQPPSLSNASRITLCSVAQFLSISEQRKMRELCKSTYSIIQEETFPGLLLTSHATFGREIPIEKVKESIRKFGHNFESLNLSNRKDLDEELFQLIGRHCSRNLKQLDLCGNSIDDAGAAPIATDLQNLTALTHLNLTWNNIGAAGAASLAPEIGKLTALTILNLSDNSISASARQLLIASLPRLAASRNLYL